MNYEKIINKKIKNLLTQEKFNKKDTILFELYINIYLILHKKREIAQVIIDKIYSKLCISTLNKYYPFYKEFDGEVSYTNTYSNNPSYYPESSNFILCTNSISDSKPVHIYNKFLVPNSPEIIQSAGQSSEGSYSNSIKIIGKPHLQIDDYLTESFSKVKKPSGVDPDNMFLKNMNYSFNPFENSFNATFEYYYTSGIDKFNTLI